jgi:hypothetical protein
MSIPFAERRKLRSIERVITAADPALADRYAMFSEHCRGRAMPRTEQLAAREVRRVTWSERWLALWMGMLRVPLLASFPGDEPRPASGVPAIRAAPPGRVMPARTRIT